MRRLIILFFPLMITCTIFLIPLSGQVQPDTIDVGQTVLEDRHLRYMYNYALNAALFQYEGGGGDHRGRIISFPLYYDDEDTILIMMEPKAIDLNNLDMFYFPGIFCHLNYMIGSQQVGITSGLSTQYHIDYLKVLPEEAEIPKNQAIQNMLHDLPNSIFAIEFSNLYYFNNRFYLEMVLHFAHNPRFSNQYAFFYFEFEWCESTEVVYAIRTNHTNLPPTEFWTPHPHPQIKRSQMRTSPTLEIPALRCPILR